MLGGARLQHEEDEEETPTSNKQPRSRQINNPDLQRKSGLLFEVL